VRWRMCEERWPPADSACNLRTVKSLEKITCDSYVEYLDKEMTIMGILSAFSVVLAGLSLDRTMGAAQGSALAETWQHSGVLLASASAAALMAAFKFYLERSLLAWYYGQLALAETRRDAEKVNDLLIDADGWDTWIQYRLGFAWLGLSSLFIALAVARQTVLHLRGWRQSYCLIALFLVSTAYSLAVRYLFRRYRLQDDPPWVAWWRDIRRDGAQDVAASGSEADEAANEENG
jgi:hypothetical protein